MVDTVKEVVECFRFSGMTPATFTFHGGEPLLGT